MLHKKKKVKKKKKKKKRKKQKFFVSLDIIRYIFLQKSNPFDTNIYITGKNRTEPISKPIKIGINRNRKNEQKASCRDRYNQHNLQNKTRIKKYDNVKG